MRTVIRALITVTLVLAAARPAVAEPLMTMIDGAPSPGVVVGWSADGKKIELTLRDDADPQAVAAAIESEVEGVRVKVRAGKLVAIGLKKAPLLKALTEVELGGDDLDILAEAASADEDFDTGSSLRAKKTASLSKLLKDRKNDRGRPRRLRQERQVPENPGPRSDPSRSDGRPRQSDSKGQAHRFLSRRPADEGRDRLRGARHTRERRRLVPQEGRQGSHPGRAQSERWIPGRRHCALTYPRSPDVPRAAPVGELC